MWERNVIFGPPGTGKTTTLIQIVCELLANGAAPDEIAFVSYTKAALKEARDRVEEQTGREAADFVWFRTLHSTCARLIGFDRDKMRLKDQHLKHFARRWQYDLTPEGASGEEGYVELPNKTRSDCVRLAYEYCRAASIAWRECPTHLLRDTTHRDLAIFAERFETYKRVDCVEERYAVDDDGERIRGADGKLVKELINVAPRWDHGDLLAAADARQVTLPSSVRYLIVDEAQDLSPVQIRIVERWIDRSDRVWVGGDDDQSIYAFMAASPSWLLSLHRDLAWEPTLLDRSWRCPEPVRAAAAAIIGRVGRRVFKDYRPREGAGRYQTRVRSAAAALAVAGSLAAGESVFVMSRTRKGAGALAWWLFDADLPYTLERGIGCPDPFGSRSLLRAIETLHLLGSGAPVPAAELAAAMGYVPSARGDTWPWAPRRGAKKTVAGWSRQTITPDDWDAIGIAELGCQCGVDPWLPLAPKSTVKILAWLRRQWDRHGGSWPVHRAAVMTWHRSKGRGADLVVIDPRIPYPVVESLGSPGGRADEEHRCAYVAVTRARGTCLVLMPLRDAYPFPASAS